METIVKNPREELKKKLRFRRGAITRLCEKSGFSRVYVYAVLNGKRKSENIWRMASEVLKEMALEQESLNQEISEALEAAESL